MTQQRFDSIIASAFIAGSIVGIMYVVYSLMAKG